MRILRSMMAASALAIAACDGGAPTAPADTADAPPATGGAPAAPSAETGAEAADGGSASAPDVSSAELPSGDVTELIIVQLEAGDGAVIEPGDTARVHYTGWLYDPEAENRRGAQFDSSRGNPQGFSFPLGAGRVIRGWDEGVAGMQVGGRRLLFIPPDYAYGERGAGGVIPPNATLVFDVELLEVLE